MGTPLPADWVKPEALRYLSGDEFEPLDARYLSGTEWEYFDALQAAEAHGRPKVLVYRRTEKQLLDQDDPEFDAKRKQWKLINAFFDSFRNTDGSLRRGYNEYTAPTDFEQNFEHDLREMIKTLLEGPEKLPPAVKTSSESSEPPLWKHFPFPGLRPFTDQDAPIFFGRGHETDGLIRKLADPGNRFIAVVGASGSGKSSLVWAGLIPRLCGQAAPGIEEKSRIGAFPGSQDWEWVRFTPGEVGDNPFMALATSLKPVLERHGKAPRDVAAEIHSDADKLDQWVTRTLAGKPDWAELLLFIDQFEELFTLVAEEHCVPFIGLLARAVQTARIRIVLTVRADFYHRCIEQPMLEELLRAGSYPLAVPQSWVLREMITRPTERAGLTFEEGLPERILNDTGTEPGALALMAFALAELYEARTGDRRLQETDNSATSHEQRAVIGVRLSLLGDPRPGVGLWQDGLPDIVWCRVPKGEVTLEEDAGIFRIDKPFCIAKYPVTYIQYRAFLEAKDGYVNSKWWQGLRLKVDKPGKQFNRRDNHPAESLCWFEAVAFCNWLSEKRSYEIRLPTEWEWQQAATGGNPENVSGFSGGVFVPHRGSLITECRVSGNKKARSAFFRFFCGFADLYGGLCDEARRVGNLLPTRWRNLKLPPCPVTDASTRQEPPIFSPS